MMAILITNGIPTESWLRKGAGNGMPAQYYDPYEFFQTGISTNNRFNISNGGEKASFTFPFRI